MLVYLNGRYVPSEDARVPVDDRGFLFGDGVYEVTRSVRGRLFAEEAHWRRLERGLAALRIDAAGALHRDLLQEISTRLLRENHLAERDATVYVQVTRGAAPRTHWFPPADTAPTVFVSTQLFSTPVELRLGGARAITVPDIRWARCDLKTVNLLPNVLMKQRARDAGAFEAIFLRDGALTEGSSTNVFVATGGKLRTPPVTNHILPGITREVVIGLARSLGLEVAEEPVYQEELVHAEEIFLVGTTTDVQPVTELDGAPVADGAPGPAARTLQTALAELMGVVPPALTD